MSNRIFTRFIKDFHCLLLLLFHSHLFIPVGLEKIMICLCQAILLGRGSVHLLGYGMSHLSLQIRDSLLVGGQVISLFIISFL